MTFLETERLILRPFRETDYGDFRAYALDPDLGRMTGLEITGETARKSFDRLLNQPRAYALVLRETGQVIGDLSVSRIPPVLEQVEALRGKEGAALSFSLAQSCRRRGLMTEAVRGVIEQLFLTEKLDYVNCGYFAFNEASQGLQKKLGFSPVATHYYHEGNRRIQVIDNVIWRKNWLEERI